MSRSAAHRPTTALKSPSEAEIAKAVGLTTTPATDFSADLDSLQGLSR